MSLPSKVSPSLLSNSVPFLLTANSFDGDGGPATEATLELPEGLSMDSFGNIYFADQANDRIRKVTPEGIISTVAGNGYHRFSGDGGPATEASINYPSDVAADRYGNLYIADKNNCRIRFVQSARELVQRGRRSRTVIRSRSPAKVPILR